MARQLLLGALIGACLTGWASLIEAVSLYGDFPYHADPLTWAGLLPTYFVVGACFGLLASLCLPLVSRRAHREEDLTLHLGWFVFCAGWLAVNIVETRMSIPPEHALFSGRVLGPMMESALWPMGAYVLGYFLWRSRFSFVVSSMMRPPSMVLGLAVLLVAALFSFLLPVRPGKISDQRAESPAPADAPNVLFIVLDTVAAPHLGSYGYFRPTSPRLDALADEGALFEHAFSAGPWTLPSHSSMFTSMLPNLHGTGWERPRLSDGTAHSPGLELHDFHTLSEELALRGYDTAGVSEKSWLSNTAGLTQGFHTYYDYSLPSLRDRFFVSRFWARYRDKFGKPAPKQIDKGGARVVDTALDWLGGNRARDEDRPFFLFMNLNEAHDPYLPPAEFKGHFRPEGATEQDFLDLKPHNSFSSHRDVILGEFTPTKLQWEMYKSLYDEEILYQDGLLGRLFDGMQEMGLKEDTLIVITADHGEEFGELSHRIGHQLSLSDRLLHVPLIMRYPELIPAGQRVSSMASTIDIFPTILDVIETKIQLRWGESPQLRSIQGVSQLPVLVGDEDAARDFIMAHYFNPAPYLASYEEWDWMEPDGGMPDEVAITMRSIDVMRTKEHKLYIYGDGQRAMVDLAQDPTEQSSEALEMPAAAQALAHSYEQRFQQQLNSSIVAYEKWIGHFAWYRREIKNNTIKIQAVGDQALEGMGYVGDTSGEPQVDLAASPTYQLPPFFRLR